MVQAGAVGEDDGIAMAALIKAKTGIDAEADKTAKENNYLKAGTANTVRELTSDWC